MRKIDALAILASMLIAVVCVVDTMLSGPHLLPNAYALWTFSLGLLPVPLFMFLFMYTTRFFRWLVSAIEPGVYFHRAPK